jgi:hypothetical protein
MAIDNKIKLAPTFTREDVELVRKVHNYRWDHTIGEAEKRDAREERLAYQDLADRIEALLPPAD